MEKTKMRERHGAQNKPVKPFTIRKKRLILFKTQNKPVNQGILSVPGIGGYK